MLTTIATVAAYVAVGLTTAIAVLVLGTWFFGKRK